MLFDRGVQRLKLGGSAAAGRPARHACIVLAGQRKDPSQDPNYRRGSSNTYWRRRTEDRKSSKGQSVSDEKRRRGRPAHMRSPDDTPLRDGNRDRLMGLLTDRATKTLVHESAESNPSLHSWLNLYLQGNSIPLNGNWSDVSGENFLRKLLTTPVEQISQDMQDPEFANASPIGGDPRQIAQRIMDIRHQIAKEWLAELKEVEAENKLVISETLMNSFGLEQGGGSGAADLNKRQASMEVDDSAAGGDD